jgi:outer membrane protein TolC
MKRSLYTLISCFVLLAFPPLASGQPAQPRLNLNQLIEEALENNPEILAAGEAALPLADVAVQLDAHVW